MGLEIKGKAASGNKTLCPRSPKAKGGATGGVLGLSLCAWLMHTI